MNAYPNDKKQQEPGPALTEEQNERLRILINTAHPATPASEALRQRVATLAADQAARDASRQARPRQRRALFGFAAAVAAVLLVSVLIGPKLVAAQALQAIGAAISDVQNAHLVHWEIAADGSRTNKSESWFQGASVRSEQETPRHITLFVDGKFWHYEQERNRVTVRRQSGYAAYNASGFTLAARQRDYARWGWKDRIRVLGDTTRNGRRVRRVSIERDEPAGQTRTLLLVDAATDLPFYYESQLREDDRWVTMSITEASYNQTLPATLFQPNFPPAAKVVDLDAEKEAWRKRLERGIASRVVGDRTIVIRDLQVNREGDVFLLYTAGKRLGDTFNAGNYLAGRDWKVELTDEFGVKYGWHRHRFSTTMNMITRGGVTREKGDTYDGARLEGDSWTPLEPQVPWKPRRFQLTFRVHPKNLHGTGDLNKKAVYTETVTFTLPVPRPATVLLPDYIPHMAKGYDEQELRRAQADARGVLAPGVQESARHIRNLIGNTDSIGAIAFSPGGAILATGAWNNGLRLWNTRTGRSLGTLDGRSPHVNFILFSPNGKTLASVSGIYQGRERRADEVRLWDSQTGKTRWVFTVPGRKAYLNRLTFSPDGKTLMGAGTIVTEYSQERGEEIVRRQSVEVKRWDMTTGKLLPKRTFPHDDFVRATVFTPDGIVTGVTKIENQAATGTVVRLWNLRTGEMQRTFEAPPEGFDLRTLAVSPDGKTIAAGGSGVEPSDTGKGNRDIGTRVHLWDVRTGKWLRTLKSREHFGGNTLAFSPDGTLLAGTVSQEKVQIWDTQSGKPLHDLVGHARPVMKITFSPDGRTLATGDLAGLVKLWRAR